MRSDSKLYLYSEVANTLLPGKASVLHREVQLSLDFVVAENVRVLFTVARSYLQEGFQSLALLAVEAVQAVQILAVVDYQNPVAAVLRILVERLGAPVVAVARIPAVLVVVVS